MGSGLTDLATRLAALGESGYQDACKACAEAVKPLVEAEFAGSHDPHGVPWKPTVRGNQPLIDTGAMAASVTADGLAITVTDWKAIFHQHGTRRGIPARPMLPNGHMPPDWVAACQAAVTAMITKRIGST